MADTDGMFGESDAPDNCIDCGKQWASSERLHTDDDKGIGGWEDWMYCAACKQEWFFPVVRGAVEAQGGGK
mgnify:FL=1